MIDVVLSLVLLLNGVGGVVFSFYLDSYLKRTERDRLLDNEVGLSRAFWERFGESANEVLYYTYLFSVWFAFLGGIVCSLFGVLGVMFLGQLY